MSVSCMLHTFIKYRDHYTSNIIVVMPMQHCYYYVHVRVYAHVELCVSVSLKIFKKGHIGIVEKSKQAQIVVCITEPLLWYMNSGCVLECRHTHITLCIMVTYIHPSVLSLHKLVISYTQDCLKQDNSL